MTENAALVVIHHICLWMTTVPLSLDLCQRSLLHHSERIQGLEWFPDYYRLLNPFQPTHDEGWTLKRWLRSWKQMRHCRICSLYHNAILLRLNFVLFGNWEAAELVQEIAFREANNDSVKVSFSESEIFFFTILSSSLQTNTLRMHETQISKTHKSLASLWVITVQL